MLFNFKNHHGYLSVLWLVFSSVVIFRLLFRIEDFDWVILGLFLLFLFTTGFVLGLVRHKEKGHPLVDDITPVQNDLHSEDAPAWLTAWQKIPDTDPRKPIAKMWCEFAEASEIAQTLFVAEKTVYNAVSDLRRIYGLPTDKDRKEYLKKSGSALGNSRK